MSDEIPVDVLLPKVRQTCIEMLEDRGYHVTHVDETQNPAIVAEGDEVAHVTFHNEPRVGVKTLRQLRENLDKRILLVSSEGPTAFTRKECDDPRIEFWTYTELLFNITRFAIAPKHSLVTAEEEEALNAKFSIKGDPWPKMYHTDPMCRYHNFPVGALVRIDRTFYKAHPYYRRVIRQ